MIPYLGPEFIRALLRQDEPISEIPKRPRKNSHVGPRLNHHGADGLLRENAQHKLISIAVTMVKQWFTTQDALSRPSSLLRNSGRDYRVSE
jgi:hypothetical protein